MRRARCALNQIGYAEKDVGAAGRGVHGVVRIGLFSSLASGFLTELLQAYVADHVVMVEEPRTVREMVQRSVPLETPVAEGIMYERLVVHLIAKVQQRQAQINGLNGRRRRWRRPPRKAPWSRPASQLRPVDPPPPPRLYLTNFIRRQRAPSQS